MLAQKIGSITTSLHNWYEKHLGLCLVLYLIALIPLTFLYAGIFLFYPERFAPGTAEIVWYFYFWFMFYWFTEILSRMNQKNVDRGVERGKWIATVRQSRKALRGIARSRETTIPVERHYAERL